MEYFNFTGVVRYEGAKRCRPSNTGEDMIHSYILGMDTFAMGLFKETEIIETGVINSFVEKKYKNFYSELGRKIRGGKATLKKLSEIACSMKSCDISLSGRQEMLKSQINSVIFE